MHSLFKIGDIVSYWVVSYQQGKYKQIGRIVEFDEYSKGEFVRISPGGFWWTSINKIDHATKKEIIEYTLHEMSK